MAWCFRLEPRIVSDEIPHQILSRFDVEISEHQLGKHVFRVLGVRNPDTLLDAVTPAEFTVDERLPYWSELWTSALALAGHCLDEPTLRGRRVLDLGCGLGLTGIAAAKNGASVLFTDYEEDALLFARWNASANLDTISLGRTSFRAADWREPETFEPYDLVLGADIVYERRNFLPLLACLQTTVRSGGEAWIAEPDRSLGGDFFALAEEHGWMVRMIDTHIERRGRTSRVRIAVLNAGKRS